MLECEECVSPMFSLSVIKLNLLNIILQSTDYIELFYKTVDLGIFFFQPDALLIFEDDQKQGKDAICEKIRVFKLCNFSYFIR